MLQTHRLNLRELTADDLANIHAMNSLPEVDFYNTLGIPVSIDTTELLLCTWLEQAVQSPRTAYNFVLEHSVDGQFVGQIALVFGSKPIQKMAEVWYKLHPDYWNKGFATEALQAVIKFGFAELCLHRIEAGCVAENAASGRVLEKAGMQREGLKRKNLFIRGGWYNSYIYAVLEEDYYVEVKPESAG